ncbi:uncharacterized protein LOC141619882 [Silene latifolia]|uniref:uncharacterized protein LOC141619882 n=1 Tax=Silene latifolia TaxID=37657 RepID=UPI003D774247
MALIREVVVETDWLQVTQDALQTLLPGNWVMDMVIDAVGIRTTIENPSVVYFPTIIKGVVGKKGFRSQYVLLDYLPLNLNTTQLAFFPYCVERSHWFACVVDFGKRMNFILDSNLPRRREVRHKILLEQLLPALEIIARDSPRYTRLLEIKNFQWEVVQVPQQKNGYSRGVYLLKWLENLCDQASWSDERSYEV